MWAVISGEGSDLYPTLYPKLEGLGDLNPIDMTPGVGGAAASYAPNASWNKATSDVALGILAKLSSATTAGFRAALDAQRRAPANPMPPFSLSSPSGQFDHIVVEVK